MMRRSCLALIVVLAQAFAQSPKPEPTYPDLFSKATGDAHRLDGFLPLYWNEKTGKMWLEVDRLDQEMLYVTALSAGVGSNDLGLDRGRMNEPKVVHFERSGPRILLVQSNYAFRASSKDPAETRAETDSFARSVLAGFDVAAEHDGHVLIDVTSFLLSDCAGVGQDLARYKQGSYRTDNTRSAVDMRGTKNFPRNTEIETIITLTGEAQGKLIREVTPTPDALTVREHQAFIMLPEAGFQPRLQDPRAGYFSVDFMDFSAPLDQPVMKRYVARHRLRKKNPQDALSEPIQPIVYYVDRGAPEPVRTALLTGGSWWNQAFEAAGFRNAFQIKLLPEDADPMDIRYNVVQWVHRSTRGWSYGNSIVDPRTGEIIKGIVTLGSLREHQDFLIFQGLIAPYAPGADKVALLDAAVLARLRQLAAHEIGHTLGLEHNFLASAHERASVMDYPGPRIEIKADDSFDLSRAYSTGIGEWDKVAIRWGYSEFAAGTNERAELDRVITDAAARGLTFITDADSRPLGSAHPRSHLWDNGSDAGSELERVLKIRKLALNRFDENNIPVDAPLASLEEVLAPLYFMHRYQTEAAAKVLGGNEYTYALRGDGQVPTRIVPAAQQRRALAAVLKTLTPETLAIPDRILELIPPRPPAYERTRELFPNRTGVTFDPIAGASAAVGLSARLLLNAERAERLEQYHARNRSNPGFPDVLAELEKTVWTTTDGTPNAALTAAIRHTVVDHALALVANPQASATVQMETIEWLRHLVETRDDSYTKHQLAVLDRDPKSLALPATIEPPPGQPIGEDDQFWPF